MDLAHRRIDSQVDKARLAKYQALQEEVAKLEAELQGHDCDKIVKEHIKALNEVRINVYIALYSLKLVLHDSVQRKKGETSPQRQVGLD